MSSQQQLTFPPFHCLAPPYNTARQPARCGLRETDQMQDIGIINKGVNEIFRNTTFGEWLALGSNKTLTIIVNKLALLWGEAQKKIAYCYPEVT